MPAALSRVAADPEDTPLLASLVAELGGDDDAPPALAHDAAGEALIRERPVHVGGVEEGDAELERTRTVAIASSSSA
jgi:hypothetical protein